MEMDNFLLQTAKDYDLPVEIVCSIYNKYGLDSFYEELENHLKIMSNLH